MDESFVDGEVGGGGGLPLAPTPPCPSRPASVLDLSRALFDILNLTRIFQEDGEAVWYFRSYDYAASRLRRVYAHGRCIWRK